MGHALDLATAAAGDGDVPVGAVVVSPAGEVIGEGRNLREVEGDPTAHAEIVALREAARKTGEWRLEGCTLVVTLEPCPMCAGAMINARIPRLVYGCPDPKAGAVRTLFRLCEDERLNHRITVEDGVLTEECAQILRDFFQRQRALGKK
jgi:tRNA(adenine34) deaminase